MRRSLWKIHEGSLGFWSLIEGDRQPAGLCGGPHADAVPWFPFCCCDKHYVQNNSGQKELYLPYASRFQSLISEVRAGIQAGTCSRNHGEALLTGLLSGLILASF